MTHTLFDLGSLPPREVYKLLTATVVPRPIAWVTTCSPEGRPNAAPYSFFNCLSSDPPILAIGVENHADMSFKDTARNIRLTEEFTVNIVDHRNLEAMNITAVAFAPEIDELKQAGLTAIPGVRVKAPRILEAPVSIECRRHTTIAVGRSREIILGLGVAIHVRSDLVDGHNHVDQLGLDAVGRMGGHAYSLTRSLLDLRTPSPDEFDAQRRELSTG